MQEETVKSVTFAVVTPRSMVKAVLLFLVLTWTHSLAQVGHEVLASNPRIQELSDARREKILDIAFPRKHRGPPGTPSVVIRFLPSFHAESQIEILTRSGTHASIIYSRARSPLQEVAHASLGTTHAGDGDLAKRMAVETTEINWDSGDMERLLVEFWKAVADTTDRLARRAQDRDVQLDGTEYTVSYAQGANRVSLMVQDSEIDKESPQDLPITRWMNTLRRRLEGR